MEDRKQTLKINNTTTLCRPTHYPLEDFLSERDKLKKVNMPGEPRISMPPVFIRNSKKKLNFISKQEINTL